LEELKNWIRIGIKTSTAVEVLEVDSEAVSTDSFWTDDGEVCVRTCTVTAIGIPGNGVSSWCVLVKVPQLGEEEKETGTGWRRTKLYKWLQHNILTK
jgi:hypothetical protein